MEAKGSNGGDGADPLCRFGFSAAGIEADGITEGNEMPFIYLPRCILAGRRRTYCLGVLTLGDVWAALAGLCKSLDVGSTGGHQCSWV